MELGPLVQFFVFSDVLSTSGTSRRVMFSWCYRIVGSTWTNFTKAAIYTQFATTALSNLVMQLNQSFANGSAFTFFPNRPGDVSQQTGFNINGVVGGNRLSLNQCVYCQLKTALRERPFRGSKHLAPVTAADAVGDELTAPGFAAWTTAVSGFTAPLTVTGLDSLPYQFKPVVWSRTRSVVPPATPGTIGADITGVYILHSLSSWRHRRERVVR